ncbi:MAG: hypothetical protein K6F86_00615 [Lachnospiraceae bacterium]|nr:hypothetical protein [Lachnospiraceae bacterium]
MKRYRKNNRITVTAGIMAVMMLVVVLFSSFFIAAHADHDCTGEDCPICACIQQCENNIHGTGSGITDFSVVILPVFITFLFISFGAPSFKLGTPVSTKVRLNN